MRTKTGIGVVCMEGEGVEKFVCHQVGIIYDKKIKALCGDSDPRWDAQTHWTREDVLNWTDDPFAHGCKLWGIRLAHCLTLDVNQILIAWKKGAQYK